MKAKWSDIPLRLRRLINRYAAAQIELDENLKTKRELTRARQALANHIANDYVTRVQLQKYLKEL